MVNPNPNFRSFCRCDVCGDESVFAAFDGIRCGSIYHDNNGRTVECNGIMRIVLEEDTLPIFLKRQAD